MIVPDLSSSPIPKKSDIKNNPILEMMDLNIGR